MAKECGGGCRYARRVTSKDGVTDKNGCVFCKVANAVVKIIDDSSACVFAKAQAFRLIDEAKQARMQSRQLT